MELISTGEGRGDRPAPDLDTVSRRGASGTWSFTEALFLGQAPDGGLFVPASIPPLPEEDRAALASLTFPERAFVVARHFLADEVADEVLRAVVHDALNFPVPLREIEPGVHLLELFHGPTHSFKDVGARFMARMMSAVRAGEPTDPAGPSPMGLSPTGLMARSDARPVTILTATSGDTGGAVAHAFHGVSGVRVLVFFPIGKISARQEAQITTLGGNVTAVAVRGTFDDCQRLVRQAFADPSLNARLSLTSANSINIGRLLPQTFYYVHAWVELERMARGSGRAGGESGRTASESRRTAPESGRTASESGRAASESGRTASESRRTASESGRSASESGRAASGTERAVSRSGRLAREFAPAAPGSELVVSVPSGNFGNLTAGLIARRMLGMSRARFVAATNVNSVVPEYLAGRGFHPRPSVATISSAMDVGDPSNFRRIRHLFGAGVREVLSASAWSDDETRACIRDLWERRGIAIDPHTAVGLLGLRRELERRPGARGVVLATAHPAKFAETVEPLIGESLPVPPGIARVMERPRRAIEMVPEMDALRKVLGEAGEARFVKAT